MSVPEPPLGRPSVEQVALFIRARTKDDQEREVGTFDDATRPTGEQVEEHISAAQSIVELRLPLLSDMPEALMPAIATVVALEAACQIEKSYWPEQVNSNRSPYVLLRQEADAALDALAAAVDADDGGTEYESSGFVNMPVKSWTRSTRCWCPPEEVLEGGLVVPAGRTLIGDKGSEVVRKVPA